MVVVVGQGQTGLAFSCVAYHKVRNPKEYLPLSIEKYTVLNIFYYCAGVVFWCGLDRTMVQLVQPSCAGRTTTIYILPNKNHVLYKLFYTAHNTIMVPHPTHFYNI